MADVSQTLEMARESYAVAYVTGECNMHLDSLIVSCADQWSVHAGSGLRDNRPLRLLPNLRR